MQVVDTQPSQRGHQVFYRRHADIALLQDGSETGVTDLIGLGGKIDHLGQINAMENDTGIGSGGPEHKLDTAAGMESDAFGGDRFLYGALT